MAASALYRTVHGRCLRHCPAVYAPLTALAPRREHIRLVPGARHTRAVRHVGRDAYFFTAATYLTFSRRGCDSGLVRNATSGSESCTSFVQVGVRAWKPACHRTLLPHPRSTDRMGLQRR